METYYDPVLPSEGPEVPPLLPGLPHTSASACKELLLHVVIRGLLDGMLLQEKSFVMSKLFAIYCMYLGMSVETTAKIQALFYQGKLKGRTKALEAVLLGAHLRFGSNDEEDRPAVWGAWANPGI